jgi:ABC-type dipeptide/oligopeptide/nickel transport system permease component
MWKYIARRLIWLPVLLLAASAVTFVLGTYGPGDPVQVMLGSRYEEEIADRIREQLGLNRPVVIQYADYVWSALHGDFGESFRYRGQSVTDLLLPKIWVSFQVNLAASIVSIGLGIPVGFWIAHRQGSWLDPATVAAFLVLMSIPIMVTIPLLLWGMCLKWGVVPCSGWGGFWDMRIIVPAIAMGVPGIAGLARMMRASTLDVLGQDFIRTARAKGLSEFTIDSVHVLKNAMIPIVTILAFSLAGMVSTGFVTETILGIPGAGRFTVESIFDRDYPIIMAVTLLGATVFVLANLLADLAYSLVDPRIRYQ